MSPLSTIEQTSDKVFRVAECLFLWVTDVIGLLTINLSGD